MQIHNAIITGSFSYNGADLSNVTSSNAYSASLSSRTTDLESTSSVLVGASSSFSSLLTSVSSSQQQISASLLQVSASLLQVSSSQQQISASLLNVIAIGATTGSNSFRATQSITGSLTVTGQIIAQTINVQQVTSSIVYSSGSNLFGNQLSNNQTFTGSVNITGSSHAIFGNVGIGISSPAEKIHVFGSSAATSPRILIQSHDTANATAGLSLYGRDASNVNKVSEIITSGSDLTISVNSAERLRITSAGNVGIGTNTPSSSLTIRSALPRVEISSTNYGGQYKSFFGSLNSAEGILQLGNNGANYILIGNTTAGGYLQFRTNINADYGYGCGLEALTIHCDTSVCFAGPVKLAGAYASCLGLGTTSSPAKYLHIQGTNNFSQGIRFSEAGGNYPHNIYFGSSDSAACGWGLDFQVATGAVTSATVLSLRGNCRVGINVTTPCSALHIVDASANATTLTIGENGEVPTIKAGGTNTDLRIEAVGGGGFLEFVTNGTNRFRTVGTGETTFTCQICTPGISITSNPIAVEYLIVAGGGGGGWDVGGGGGAGGTLTGSTGLFPGTYTVGIGAGGAGSTGTSYNRGFSTYAMGLITIGGGPGGNYNGGSGLSGGSGGGGAGYGATTNAGYGMTGQGFAGGCGINVGGTNSTGGGGGGATGIGCISANNLSGFACGGPGILTTIIGATCSFACGGKGGGDNWGGMTAGPSNSGYGGDGAGNPNTGYNGASGVFVIKALNTNSISFSGGLTVTTCTNVGGFNIYVVTAGAGTMTIS